MAGAGLGLTRHCTGALLTRDGRRRCVEWSASTFSRSNRGKRVVLVVGHDITELQEAQQQALRAERLAAIGQVVASLAHESRNLLQHSQACIERLRWRLHDQPEPLELLARLQRTQRELAHLLEDVRGYAAPLRIERASCDVRAVLREAWEEVQAGFPGKEAFLEEAGDAAPTLRGRPLPPPAGLSQCAGELLQRLSLSRADCRPLARGRRGRQALPGGGVARQWPRVERRAERAVVRAVLHD